MPYGSLPHHWNLIMRRIPIAISILFALFAAGCSMGDDEIVLAPDSVGEIVIDMNEFDFGVDLIEVTAGQTVTFVILNSGANEHEFMIGRDVVETDEGYPNGFVHDFFETVTPIVDPPSAGMDMGAMDMGGMDMGSDDMASADDDHAEESMDMDMDMPAADEDMAEDMDMDMDMPAADEDHDEEPMDPDMDMDMGDEAGDGDAHAGYMVQRRPGEVARLTVTIPSDVIGEWEIGCFRGRGSHWDAGMNARLIVSAA